MGEVGVAVVGKTNFARQLGSADKKTREKGLSLLLLWLSCQQDVEEDELKKIWKGLFFCLWHSDKAQVQGDLINKLAGILDSLDADTSLAFFKVFLTTMRREWSGIDRLRLDKFYRLLRQVLTTVFGIFQKSNWDGELIGKYMNALVERSLLAKDHHPALGVNLHFADIFLSELRKFQPLPYETLGLILQSYYDTLASAPDKSLLERVKSCVFLPLLEEAESFVKSTQAGNELDESSFGPLAVTLPISARLFEFASAETTPHANRKVLYEIHAECVKLDQLVASSGIDFSRKVRGSTNSDIEMGEGNVSGATRQVVRQTGARAKRDQEGVENASKEKKRKVKDVSLSTSNPHGLKKTRATGSELLNVEPKKSTKKGTVKQVKSSKHEVSVNGTDETNKAIDSENVGTEVNVGNQVNVEQCEKVDVKKKKKKKKATKQEALAETAPVEALNKSKRKGTKSVGKGKSSHVPAVETDDLVEIPKHLCVDASVGVENAIEGEQVQPEAAKSSIAQVLVGTGISSEMRVAESVISLSVDDAVISNLEQKFDSIAAESHLPTASNGASKATTLAESVGKKKRKRGKVTEETESLLTENNLSPGQLLTRMVKTGALEQTPETNSKKKVKFVLKNNIVWKPNNPLPPRSMRTPPSATPRGSALKKGVPAGPIRVIPTRKTGSGSKRRSPSQILSISNQKTVRSAKSLSKGPRLARRVRKSPASM